MSGPARICYTEEEYLAFEETSDIRHEYLGGWLVAMAGESVDHNTIAGNIVFKLRSHLKGGPCRTFMENVKVKLDIRAKDLFYYPAVMLACGPKDNHSYYRERPKLLIEVISPSSVDKDEAESQNYLAYQRLDSLEEYVIVRSEPGRREVRVFRKDNDWGSGPGVHVIGSGEIELRSVGVKMTLDEIYDLS